MAAKDKRNPPPTSSSTTNVMKANKGRDTKPEVAVRLMLRQLGHPGYRLNWKGAPGRPDIAYPGRKIAIFVNGCFWHRCPICNLPLPKSHTDFWTEKYKRNVERDERKITELETAGWKVTNIWEGETKKDSATVEKELAALFKSA